MKYFLIVMLFSLSITANANYTLIVPQTPGGGTSVWAEIIAKNLTNFLDEPVVVRHIPGAKNIPGFNKFENDLKNNDKVIMVSHGGNGVSYLLDEVDYDYLKYSSIGMMNLDIVVGKKKDVVLEKWIISGSSGMEPDGMAIAMLICGPEYNTVADMLVCWNEKVIWVNGMSGGERRLSFLRNETNISRESPASWIKNMKPVLDNEIWFTHGIYDLKLKTQIEDPNFPGTHFDDVYYNTWGTYPSGEFYESYKMMRNWRDVMQKALWVRKGNPNTEKLITALKQMLNDPKSVADITKRAGNYNWIVGNDGDKVVEQLSELITKEALETAVTWTQDAYKFGTIYKPELIK